MKKQTTKNKSRSTPFLRCLCVTLYVVPHYPKGFCVTTTAAVTIQQTEVTEFSISFCEMNMLFVVASCVAEEYTQYCVIRNSTQIFKRFKKPVLKS